MIVRPEKYLYRRVWFVFNFEKVPSESTSSPWAGLQLFLRPLLSTDLATHSSPTPFSRALGAGTLPGKGARMGQSHTGTTATAKWGPLLMRMEVCAPGMFSSIQCRVQNQDQLVAAYWLTRKGEKKKALGERSWLMQTSRQMMPASPPFLASQDAPARTATFISTPTLLPLLHSCQRIKLFPLPSVLSRCCPAQSTIWYCIWSITFTAIYSN